MQGVNQVALTLASALHELRHLSEDLPPQLNLVLELGRDLRRDEQVNHVFLEQLALIGHPMLQVRCDRLEETRHELDPKEELSLAI